MTFLEELRMLRWDDHRLYHHSRINQSLHLISALSFLSAYLMITLSPVWATLVGWVVAMWSRQIGHFFFEPKGFDEINSISHAEKEAIKVGYNLQRKVVLMGLWAVAPVLLWFNPGLFGLVEPHLSADGYIENLAYLWLVLGVAGLLFRTVHLFFIRGIQTGLAWCTKILTDPFNDVVLYHKAPWYLLRGERYDQSLRRV